MKKRLFYIFALAAIFTGCKSQKNSKQTAIGFYNIEANTQKGIQNVLSDIAEKNDLEVSFFTFNDENNLSDEIKTDNIQLIITEAGYSLKNSLNAVANQKSKARNEQKISTELLSGMTSSMQQSAVIQNGNLTAMPVLINHLELDADISALRSAGYEEILSIKDFNEYAKKQLSRTEAPVLFAAKDYVFYMDLLGALCEAFDGVESYNKAREILESESKADFNAQRLFEKLTKLSDSPLYNSIYFLKTLYKNKLIADASFGIKQENLEIFFKQRDQKLFFTSLSNHRCFKSNIMNAYSSIFVPSNKAAGNRTFTANLTYAIPVTKSAASALLMKELCSEENQEALSRATGLAPASRTCRCPDIQASDVRYWIAATNAPLAGLGHEVYFTNSQLEALFAEINAEIKYGK